MEIKLLAATTFAYIDNHLFVLVLLACVVTIELFLSVYLTNLRLKFTNAQKTLTEEALIEKMSVEYYSKKQRAIMTRTLVFSAAILLSVLYYDVRAFSFFAVALGAIIVTFKETVVSMLSYFHILRNYHVGDDIKVNGVRGEILNIRPTQTTLIGKEDNGEYNGKITIVQNYQFAVYSVERQEMKSHSYLMASITVPFESELFSVSFKDFISSLRSFLDGMLPSRGMNSVGYYRSYSGVRYKINYSYDKDARIMINISFVSKPRRISDRKEKIISFVESMKNSQ